MQINPETFPTDLQICREFALLGNYDTCLLYFEPLLSSISTYAKSQDKDECKKWMDLREELLLEFKLVKDIHQEINSFKERRITKTIVEIPDKDIWPSPDPLPTSIKKQRQTNKGKVGTFSPEKFLLYLFQSSIYLFTLDQLPSWARNSNKDKSHENHKSLAPRTGLLKVWKILTSKKQAKPKNTNINTVTRTSSQTKQPSSPQIKKTGMKKSSSSNMLEKANNDKNSRKSENEDQPPAGEIEENGRPESKKINRRFEGTGFDKELVEMVKRDILVRSPNVRWTNIAG